MQVMQRGVMKTYRPVSHSGKQGPTSVHVPNNLSVQLKQPGQATQPVQQMKPQSPQLSPENAKQDDNNTSQRIVQKARITPLDYDYHWRTLTDPNRRWNILCDIQRLGFPLTVRYRDQKIATVMYNNLCDVHSHLIPDMLLPNPLPLHGVMMSDEVRRCLLSFEDGCHSYLPTEKDHYAAYDGINSFFTEEVRLQARFGKGQAPLTIWKDRKILDRAFDILIRNEWNLTPANLKEALYTFIRECKIFNPSAARALIDIFQPPAHCDVINHVVTVKRGETMKVLDPSAGWGDRLIGAISAGVIYHGFDPNIALGLGHDKIIETFARQKQNYQIIYQPFESDKVILTEKYDLVMACPPCFNLEKYSFSPTQSSVAYPNLNAWLEKCLLCIVRKSWAGLREGGSMILYLHDNITVQLTEVANLFIGAYLPNAHYAGVIGIETTTRACYPAWIWQKGEGVAIGYHLFQPLTPSSIKDRFDLLFQRKYPYLAVKVR